jgi:hypothetical protein
MDTKLTIKLNDSVINKAKIFAKSRRTSLSKMIESYLEKVSSDTSNYSDITPLVKSLSGIINLPENSEHNKEYTDYLINKYK